MALLSLAPIQVDAERARAFVLAHGTARETARLEGIFGAVGPSRDVVREYEAVQNQDGGFAGGQTAGAPSSVDTTCSLLEQLKDLPPLAGSPMASRAVAYLRRVQQVDGSWRESEGAVPLAGPWARPENPAAAAYLTAAAAYALVTLEPAHMDPIARAAQWLRKSLVAVVDQADIPAQTLAWAWAVFYKLWGPGAHEVAWCYEHLHQRQMDAPERAWGLSCALEIGAGGKYLIRIVQGLGSLAEGQQADGSWPAEPGLALESTLTALRVFRGYGII